MPVKRLGSPVENPIRSYRSFVDYVSPADTVSTPSSSFKEVSCLRPVSLPPCDAHHPPRRSSLCAVRVSYVLFLRVRARVPRVYGLLLRYCYFPQSSKTYPLTVLELTKIVPNHHHRRRSNYIPLVTRHLLYPPLQSGFSSVDDWTWSRQSP